VDRRGLALIKKRYGMEEAYYEKKPMKIAVME
jgi:hypothetical protein